jgi:MoxR-like ATPase
VEAESSGRPEHHEPSSEAAIIRLNRGEESGAERRPTSSADRPAQQVVFAARSEINRVNVSEAVENYMVALVFATR